MFIETLIVYNSIRNVHTFDVVDQGQFMFSG